MNVGINNDNSYILIGDKTAVIECVDKKHCDIHTKNIQQQLGDKTLDYIILNHTAPENIGSLEQIMSVYPDATVIASNAGIKNLSEILNRSFKYELAKDEAVLDLGKNIQLKFYILPNLPWTDTMAVYSESDGILYGGNIFRNDENYFASNLKMYAEYAKNAVKRLSSLKINSIYPMYGAVIENPHNIFETYSSYKCSADFIPIIYSSKYGYTAEMADVIYEAFTENRINAKIFNADDEKELHKIVNSCSYFAIGTNTINRNAPESVWNILTKIDMINKRHTPCLIFGSCGWSGEGVYLVERFLKNIALKPFNKPFLTYFKISDNEKEQLKNYVQKFIASLK